MTRNLYLGADLTPALQATGVNGAVDAAYQIEQQVHRTQFPTVRAALLANEIKKRKPDVVGLQEAALWRTGPYDLGAVTSGPKATQIDPQGGDFLSDLLAKLNKGGKKKGKKGAAARKEEEGPAVRYRIAVVKTEFDFELPVNQGSGGLTGCPTQCHNERLTMRDAILVKKGVKTSNASSGTFNTLLRVKVGGVLNVDVTRGWAAVDAKVNGKKVHVVDSHLEAFDSGSSNTGSDGIDLPEGRHPRGSGQAAGRSGRSHHLEAPDGSARGLQLRFTGARRPGGSRVTRWRTGRCSPAAGASVRSRRLRSAAASRTRT